MSIEIKAGSMAIGTDICSVERIRDAYERYGKRFLNRILTVNEIEYVIFKTGKNQSRSLANLTQTVAGRFAAKEAVAKALGTGWRGLYWKEVEIINSGSGKPQVMLSGRANQLMSKLGFSKAELSLSHEKDYALAMVVLH